jgi:hypothetical protein
MVRSLLAACTSCLMLSLPATAAQPAKATGRVAPALLVQISEDRPAEPLAVAKVDVRVLIEGFLAETTTTLTFRSAHPRPLEGDLVFPLPEGAAISGYGLDVNGEMVDGVPVEAHAARIAFETELRRGVDPGLAEWVQGNNFRTRVWPIPTRGARTVKVSYVSDLVTRGEGEARDAFYQLPLRYPAPVEEFHLKVEVVKGVARPEVRSGGPAHFAFEKWQDRYVAETRLTGAALDQDLLVALPRVPRQHALVERDANGRCVFVIDDFPAIPSAPPHTKPRRIAVMWDASLSREQASLARELDLLATHLRSLADVEVDLVAFRDVAEPTRRFAVRGGDASALLAHVRGLPLDGGTNLGALRVPAGIDYALLFSDGLGNLGGETPRTLAARLFAVSADARANHALLAWLAESSGGAYLNLGRLSQEQALATLGSTPFSLLAVEHDNKAVAELSPEGRQPVQGRLTLTGRLLAPEATLTLRYGFAGAVQSRTVTLRQADAVPGSLLARFWAQRKAAALSVFPERNHDALLALGHEHGLVTPGTSLLVLETLDQYVQHGIEPPTSRPALLAEYRKRAQDKQVSEKQARVDKLQQVLELWKRRVDWWSREFRYDPAFRFKDERDGQPGMGVEAGVAGGVVGRAQDAVSAARRAGPAAAPPAPARALEERIEVRAESPAGAEADAKLAKGGAQGETATGPAITLKAWDPKTPYLEALKAAGAAGAYAAYLAQRKDWGRSPAFFLDCADFLIRQQQRVLGIRVLTSVVELELGEPRLLRIAAHRLQQLGEHDLAVALFEEVARMRPEEPQSPRDLALALEARADARRAKAAAAARADDVRAVDLLNQVVLGRWDGRFPEIEVIALEEANRIMAVVEREARPAPQWPVDPRLRKLLDVDMRIVLTWDTDMTDMDLWVIEPSGEKCFYSHALTTTGGTISRDFTGGYGPEEYLVRRGMAGEYAIKANFYGSRSQTLTGPTTVQATVITNFGRPNEERQALTLRLGEAREVVDIGAVRFAGPQPVR